MSRAFCSVAIIAIVLSLTALHPPGLAGSTRPITDSAGWPRQSSSEIAFSTFLGGAQFDGNDLGWAVAADAEGNAYIGGETLSSDFPVTNGAFDTRFDGGSDAFVAKLSRDGGALVYATLLGGSGRDRILGLALDGQGQVSVVGVTTSPDFPTGPSAYDSSYGGAGLIGHGDAFVAKLSADGRSLAYSTYLGGEKDDFGAAITIDDAGNAYVTGWTSSANFPVSPGAFGSAFSGRDAFVSKLNPAGTLVFSALLGPGEGRDVASDTQGNVYVTGHTSSSDFPVTSRAFDTSFNAATDAFVVKLSAAGSDLWFSTFLGGGRSEYGRSLAVDSARNVYVAGYTNSSDFPTTGGSFDRTLSGLGRTSEDDLFIAKFDLSGGALLYSTYLGGSGQDGYFVSIAVDHGGRAFVSGNTQSSDFPTTADAQDSTYNGGVIWGDAFLSALTATGDALVNSTLIGGSGNDRVTALFVDHTGGVYVVGVTNSSDFPVSSGAFDTTLNRDGETFWEDAFAAKFVFAPIGGSPPVIVSTIPPAAIVELFAGEVRSFNVVAEDPDGDALTYAWTIDGIPVGDRSPNYYFAEGYPGMYALRVTISDNELSTTYEWRVRVMSGASSLSSLLLWIAVGALLLALPVVSVLVYRRMRRT